jgi:hypothetical protein
MIYVCEHHDRVLELWRRQDLRRVALVHVDFHDDLRGLLVDRRRRLAYAVGELAAGGVVDAGNFLAHAVLERRLTRLRWLHGEVGGRAWDLGIVRYESDWFALRHRLSQAWKRRAEVPLEFEERRIDDWPGIAAGERLSLDWDCFASRLQDAEGIDARLAAFCDRLGQTAPADSYLAYSPEYCRPSLERFLALVERLGARFGQTIEWLSPGLREGRLQPSGVRTAWPRRPLPRLALFLRRRGIF